MANLADKLKTDGKKVLFAFEEAIGFMCGTVVLDKDGVGAAIRVAECVNYLASQNQTLVDKLKMIYTA